VLRRVTPLTVNLYRSQHQILSANLPGLQHCLVAKPNRASFLQPCYLSSFDAQIDLNFLFRTPAHQPQLQHCHGHCHGSDGHQKNIDLLVAPLAGITQVFWKKKNFLPEPSACILMHSFKRKDILIKNNIS
jgi:hypothetical protein